MSNTIDASRLDCQIALCNPKSAENVGGIMRAAGCYGASKVLFSGQRFKRAAKFQMDTQSVTSHIPLLAKDDLFADLEQDTQVVCVEFAVDAIALPLFQHPLKARYIFGPEDGSLSQAVVDRADHVVYIPTHGCMNLAATVNVLLYDRMAKHATMPTNNDLILASRDTNNNLRIKSAASVQQVSRRKSQPIPPEARA